MRRLDLQNMLMAVLRWLPGQTSLQVRIPSTGLRRKGQIFKDKKPNLEESYILGYNFQITEVRKMIQFRRHVVWRRLIVLGCCTVATKFFFATLIKD